MGVYTSGCTGRTYILYKQCGQPWPSSVGGTGICNRIAAAIIMSGYDNIGGNIAEPARNPVNGLQGVYSDRAYPGSAKISEGASSAKPKIINNLQNGGEVAIWVKASGGSGFTNLYHWMALLDVNADGSQVFVSNVNQSPGGGGAVDGWYDTDVVLRGLATYVTHPTR